MVQRSGGLWAIALFPFCVAVPAQSPQQIEFFENNVRPVLTKNCQMCHNGRLKTSSLDLTTSQGFLASGQRGPIVSCERPETSRILKVISYEVLAGESQAAAARSSGVKPGFIYGSTDNIGYYAVEDRMHIHDFHATVLALLGLDHETLTYRYSGPRFPADGCGRHSGQENFHDLTILS